MYNTACSYTLFVVQPCKLHTLSVYRAPGQASTATSEAQHCEHPGLSCVQHCKRRLLSQYNTGEGTARVCTMLQAHSLGRATSTGDAAHPECVQHCKRTP